MNGAGILTLWIFVVAGLGGCTTTIVPPGDIARATHVAVLDHGRHSSLVVQNGSTLTRYSYGDWDFYALADEGVFEASSALLWPTQAGLGRKKWTGPFSRAFILDRLRVVVDEMFVLQVEASDADALVQRLDSLFARNIHTRIYNRAYDLDFVHHPQSYWMFRNSNQRIASWLEELNCRIEGWALFSSWEVE